MQNFRLINSLGTVFSAVMRETTVTLRIRASSNHKTQAIPQDARTAVGSVQSVEGRTINRVGSTTVCTEGRLFSS